VPAGPPLPGRAGRALQAATQLAESKQDPDAAARVLDPVLAEIEAAGGATAGRALVLRAGIAAAQGDRALVRELVARARAVRGASRADLDRAHDLLDGTDEQEEIR
jgi:hypothetical protein